MLKIIAASDKTIAAMHAGRYSPEGSTPVKIAPLFISEVGINLDAFGIKEAAYIRTTLPESVTSGALKPRKTTEKNTKSAVTRIPNIHQFKAAGVMPAAMLLSQKRALYA